MKQQRFFVTYTFPVLFSLCLFTTQVIAADGEIKSPDTIPGSTRVDAEQVINLAGAKDNLVVIDSRITDDRHQGYIEGSISLPDESTDCETLSMHLKSEQTPVLFYCNGPKCGRSAKAVNIALGCGYTDIYWFRGGYEEWKAKNYPFIKD